MENYSFEEFKEYLPDYINDVQVKFCKQSFGLLMADHDTTKVTAIAERCGMGKSTFINTFIKYIVAISYRSNKPPLGVVVISDSIKRLEKLADLDRNRSEIDEGWDEMEKHYGNDIRENAIVLQAGEPFGIQLRRQHYKPVVFLSTQRYFMMSEDNREQLFSFEYKGEDIKRNLILFDERPYFTQQVNIQRRNLNNIDTAISQLSNKVDQKEKEFVLREWEALREYLISILKEYEYKRKDDDLILYWNDIHRNAMTVDDKEFLRIITTHADEVTKQYRDALTDLNAIQEIVANGAIISTLKINKRSSEFEMSFNIVRDNRAAFFLGGTRKFFVFDATADIDPQYDVDYVKMAKIQHYNGKINMNLKMIRFSTGKTNLLGMIKNQKYARLIECTERYLKDELRECGDSLDDILWVSYSQLVSIWKSQDQPCVSKKQIEMVQKRYSNTAYFGNLKGSNVYKDLGYMVHFGMNRQPSLNYMYLYFGIHSEKYQMLKSLSEKESIKMLDRLSLHRESELSDEIKEIHEIMCRSILVDFEQNVFRTAIRNVDNDLKVTVWAFFDFLSERSGFKLLGDMIVSRFKGYGAKVEKLNELPGYKEAKQKSRKPKVGMAKTNVQKVLDGIDWFEMQAPGTTIKRKEFLEHIGLKSDQFTTVLHDNAEIKRHFQDYRERSGKQGVYMC